MPVARLIHMNLQTRLKEINDSPVIELKGEMDLFTFPVFKDSLFEVIESGRMDIVVDLTGLDFIDSTGLAILLAAFRELRDHGGSMRIVCDNNAIRKVFDKTGLDRVFPIYLSYLECLEERRPSPQ